MINVKATKYKLNANPFDIAYLTKLLKNIIVKRIDYFFYQVFVSDTEPLTELTGSTELTRFDWLS
ncbi:hypothetical protein Hanom_Chr02g00124441 [Helianthus anomalus]